MLIQSCILLSMLLVVEGQTGTEACVKKGTAYECIGGIPRVLPPNITDVHVKGYSREHIDGTVFRDKSWSGIESFRLHVYRHIHLGSIGNYTFSPLSELIRLEISAYFLETIEERAFAGLNKLKVLDLSGCQHLKIESIVSSLSVSCCLDTLILDKVRSAHSKILRLRKNFFDMVLVKNITKLSLANTNLYLDLKGIHYTLPVIELNGSHSNPYTNHGEFEPFVHIFGNLRVIDMSGFKNRDYIDRKDGQVKYTHCVPTDRKTMFYTKMTRFYANNVDTDYFTNYVLYINLTACPVNIQVIHLRSSKIYRFNLTVYWPKEAPLMEMDLSDNNMRFFHVIGHMPVFRLFLSHNRIYQMRKDPVFADSFNAFPFLEELFLDNNELVTLPRDLFLQNKRLKHLDLTGNSLVTLTLNIGSLHSLNTLNLSGNHIEYMNMDMLSVIDHLQAIQLGENRTSIIVVDFRENGLVCSCQRYDSISWLWSKRKQITGDVYKLKCKLGEEMLPLEETVLRKVKLQCKLPMITAVSSSIVIFAVAVVFGGVYAWRSRVKNIRRQQFLDRFMERKTQERFLALLSYSKIDSNVVFMYIRPRLEEAMRKIVAVDFDLLCLGDIHFRPGMALVDEIHRSVAESCVAIFVISRAFCESGYCQCEMKEAYAQNKPMILLFLEEVDEELMTPLIQSIFRSFTRAKITVDNDNVTITPSCETLSRSIIVLILEGQYRSQLPNCCKAL